MHGRGPPPSGKPTQSQQSGILCSLIWPVVPDNFLVYIYSGCQMILSTHRASVTSVSITTISSVPVVDESVDGRLWFKTVFAGWANILIVVFSNHSCNSFNWFVSCFWYKDTTNIWTDKIFWYFFQKKNKKKHKNVWSIKINVVSLQCKGKQNTRLWKRFSTRLGNIRNRIPIVLDLWVVWLADRLDDRWVD